MDVQKRPKPHYRWHKVRNLRAVFNEAISIGTIKREKCYPFGKRRCQIPTGRNIKKALDHEAIRKIYYHEPEAPGLKKAKAFWLFCYFGNGMNPKDIVYLKWKDIEEDYFVFNRSKTLRTTKQDPRPLTVYITDDMQHVINQYGTNDKHPDTYVSL
jgi:integrase/recombinase XerD